MASKAQRRGEEDRQLYVVVREGARAAVLAAARRCLGRLVPGATLLVAPAGPPAGEDAEVLTLDAEELTAGPLSAATALERARAAGGAVPR